MYADSKDCIDFVRTYCYGKKGMWMRINLKNITRVVFILYLIAVLFFTFIVRETMILRTTDNRGVILEPFREIDSMLHHPNHFFWFMQIFLNILLFIPLGFLLPIISKRFRNLWHTTVTGFVFSVGIETMQYITGRGLTEVDDIINNTAGALVGYSIYAIMMYLHKKTQGNNHYWTKSSLFGYLPISPLSPCYVWKLMF